MVTRVLIASLVLVACTKKSDKYCELHAEDIANCGYSDAGIDARPTCGSSADCVAPAPHCDVPSMSCVECVDNTHCPSADAPYCDPATFTCKGCVSHEECASGACLPTGVCGDDTNVAFVDPTAAGTTCTALDPCMLVAEGLATQRPYIKLTGQILEPVLVEARTVTLLADEGTTLSRANNGIVLDIKAASTVAIYDLTVIGKSDKGIVVDASTARLFRSTVTECNAKDKVAVEAKATSTLSMSRSLIFGNIGGGIRTDATTTYNITNTFIVRNGADDSAFGGATLEATNPGERRFEMNTVVDNRAKLGSGIAGGVACFASGLAIPNNILVRNYSGGSTANFGANELTVTAHCNTGDSLLGQDASLFQFKMSEGAGPWDYRINAGSMAIDRGVTSDIGFDYEGHLRPQGSMHDVGADEFKL